MASLKAPLERLATVVILFGIFSLCQPFAFDLYRYGFTVLLVGTVLFTIVSHVPERKERADR